MSSTQQIDAQIAAIVERHRGGDGIALESLALALAAYRPGWQPVADAADGTHRHWRKLYGDAALDVYAISWLAAQTTGFHDHCASHFAVACAQGGILEDRPGKPGAISTVHTVKAGQTTHGRDGVIHRLRYFQGTPAITIHCYAPTLTRVGQFYVDEHGSWLRIEQDGEVELTEGALPC